MMEGKRLQRPLQDFVSWKNFLTRSRWEDVEANPTIASEIILQFVNKLGLICPSEGTCASLAAAIIVCVYCRSVMVIGDSEIDRIYHCTKVRIKQLYKSEPAIYLVQLPPTPAAFLSQCPDLAKKLYSVENLPISCPLNPMSLSAVEARISMRGKQQKRGGLLFY